MAGLVADYGSESENEDSDSSKLSNDNSNETALPKPSFVTGSDECTKGSVFVNPFIEVENAKNAILEKHVKMISTDVNSVNGKKICWNYRKKNRCRFGHNCMYAHDSDLQIDKSTIPETHTNTTQISVKKFEEAPDSAELVRKKKRLGLGQSINPSKKVMKIYNKQKAKLNGT